jgi:hypothetical protein
MKVMVWGAFWDTGKSNYYIMDRDFESKKHGYFARSYLEVCNAEVAPIFEQLDDRYILYRTMLLFIRQVL